MRPSAALLCLLVVGLGPNHGASQGGVQERLAASATSEGPPPPPLVYPPGGEGLAFATFGLGCFWGGQLAFDCATAEVTATQTGYKGGSAPRPGYVPAYSDYSANGYTEGVQVLYGVNSGRGYSGLLDVFWASHDATHPNTNVAYRSVIWYHDELQRRLAVQSKVAREAEMRATPVCVLVCPKDATGAVLPNCDLPGCMIHTAIEAANTANFWPAEEYHQNWDRKLGETCASEEMAGSPYCMQPTGCAEPPPLRGLGGGH